MDGLIDRNHRIEELVNTMIEVPITWINDRISELESAKPSNDEELKLNKTRIDELNLTKMRLQQEWTSKSPQVLERLMRNFENGDRIPADRIAELQFRNKISESILTGDEIPIELALVDSTTNNIIEAGQESSAKVEIVVLNEEIEDDLTGEAFKEKIVPEMEDKKPFLKGNPQVKLRQGKAFLDKLSFRHHTIKMKPPRFRLGARIPNQIFDGVRIKEAMTDVFTVKDFRNKYNRKHEKPLLTDEVSRLINIGRRGKIVKNLKDNKIETVEHFLIHLLINPEGLKRIVNLRQKKKWEATVNNARACQNDGKIYCYVNRERKTGVVFNVLGEVLRLYSNNQYATTAVSHEDHQEDVAQKLLSAAYIHWEDVSTFNDKNDLEEYLTRLSISDPQKLDYHGEMIGESSSRSNSSFHSISSGMNLVTEIDDDDMISIGGKTNQNEFMQHSPQSSFNQEMLVSDFDKFYLQTRWRKLWHVSRLFSIGKKRHSFGGYHYQKKQKTG